MPVQKMQSAPNYLKLLVYGFTGVGKTRLVATVAELDEFMPCLFVDADRGTMSIPTEHREHPQMYYWELTKYMELNDIYVLLTNIEAYREARPEEVLPDEPFKSVIIDDLAEVYWMGLNLTIAQDITKHHPDRDPYLPQLQDYGKARLMMHKLLRRYRDLPIHSLICMQAGLVQDSVTGRTQVGLQAVGKLVDDIPVHFDMVTHLTVARDKDTGDAVRRLVLQPSSVLRAKNRAFDDGEPIDNPTIAAIVERCTHMKQNKE